MSLMLSFRGRLEGPDSWSGLVEAARSFAADMEWTVESLRVPCGAEAGAGQAEVPGLALRAHFAVPPLPLVALPPAGQLIDAYVRDLGDGRREIGTEPMLSTLFGGFAVHREICDFLQLVRERFAPELDVDDESGWWIGREEAAAQAAFAEAWAKVGARARSEIEGGAESIDWAGYVVRGPRSEAGEGADDEALSLIGALAQSFALERGGMDRPLAVEEDGVRNLDLLLDDVLLEEEWAALRESAEGERLVHGAGAVFGQQLLERFGGRWRRKDAGLDLVGVAGIGLEIDPFEAVFARLEQGPPAGLTLVEGLLDDLRAAWSAGAGPQ